MLVEHSFVTTLDAPETLEIITQMLYALGFSKVAPSAGKSLPAEVCREFIFPDAPPARTGTGPLRVLLSFDRGRVMVAASASARQQSAFRYRSGTFTRKQKALLEEKLMLTAGAVESILTGESMESIQNRWEALNTRWRAEKAIRRRRGLLVGLAILALAIFFVIRVATLIHH